MTKPYVHPVGRCQSIQCAACFNLTDPTQPIERLGYCRHGLPLTECPGERVHRSVTHVHAWSNWQPWTSGLGSCRVCLSPNCAAREDRRYDPPQEVLSK